MRGTDGSAELPATLVDALRSHVEAHGDRVAVTFLRDGEEVAERLTYAELDLRARAAAQRLRGWCAPGARALLLFDSNVEFVVAFLACLYAKVVAVPAYPPRANHHLTRLRGLVEDSAASLVLLAPSVESQWGDRAAQLLPQLSDARWQVLADDPGERDALAAAWTRPDLGADDLAFLQYTSGSTGAPKGVMVTHGSLVHNAHMAAVAFGHDETSTFVGWLPLFHDMGLIGKVLQPLWAGGQTVLMSPAAFISRPARWLRAVARHGGANCTSGAPNFAYELCARKVADRDLEGVDLSGWHVAFNGAEPVRAEVLDAFADRFARLGFRRSAFYPCYGMAEATLFVSGNPRGTEPVVIDADAAALEQGRLAAAAVGRPARRLVSCGKAWLDLDVRIVDPTTGAECAPGQVGEIWLSSASIARGYWGRPEASAEAFAAELPGRAGRYLRTGDLGVLDGDQLYVTGRRKDLIIVRGRNHYPQDLEATCAAACDLLRPDGIAAFSIEGATGEELVVVAEVARVHRRDVDGEAVVGKLREAVSAGHDLMLHAVVLIDQAHLPKTSSGKIQRSVCRSAFVNGTFKALYQWRAALLDDSDQPPADGGAAAPAAGARPGAAAIADWLAARLALRLKLPLAQVDPREPLAHYGMDSALAVSLVEEVGRWLDEPLDPMLFWEHPTIERFAAHVAELIRR